MLGDPLFLHFDYMQFAQFTDGLWTCWMRILPDPSGNPITIQPLIVAHKSGIIDASDAAKKRLKTAIADSLKTVDFICDVNFSRGSIQAVLKTFEIPRPILYRKEIKKNGRRLVGYENATGRPIVPFGKYARCHTPIISENRIGIVGTDEGKFIAIDHTGKKLFEIMFQSPVLSVEDLFRYGYFIYVTRNGRQGVATISGLRYTQPTHEPIEQLAMFRAMPNFHVFRPCDATETEAAWYSAVTSEHTPTALVLTRQNLEPMAGSSREALKGGYIIDDCEGTPELILIASGSEVALAVHAKETLAAEGQKVRVVSMPCMDLFEEQSEEYKESVLPREVRRRVAVEALGSFGWDKYTGLDGKIIAMESFGASAPAGLLFKKFGFTVEHVVEVAKSLK